MKDPTGFLSSLVGKTPDFIKKKFKLAWENIAEKTIEQGKEEELLDLINKRFDTNFKSLNDISKKVPLLETRELINEDFKHFWQFFKSESWPILTIFPSLQVWFEIDKLLFGNGDIDEKKLAFYGSFWILMITGNFIKQWNKWRKEHPEEYEKEGKKKNPFSLKEQDINSKIESYMISESTKKLNPNKYDSYDDFFKAMLKKYKIKNVRNLEKEDKKAFFKEVENEWSKRKEK